MAKIIGADSLAFISLDGLYRALGSRADAGRPGFCDACFTGDYAIPLVDQRDKANVRLSLLAAGQLMSGRRSPARSRWSPARRVASARRRRWSWRGSARTSC
jgi:hypothetical protein